MVVPPRPRAGVLTIRLWLEQDGAARPRARITYTRDVESLERVEKAVADVDEAMAIVRWWLESIVSTGGLDRGLP